MAPTSDDPSATDDRPRSSETGIEFWLGSATVSALGLLSFALNASYLLRTDPPVIAVILGPLIPLLLSVGVLGAALWLLESSYRRFTPRIALWCVGGAVVFVAIGQLLLLFQRATGATIATPLFVRSYLFTNGTVIGFVVGIYDADLQQTTRDLDAERERAEQLSQRLSVLNRVLRHDIRSSVQSIRGYAEMLADPPRAPSTVPVERIRERASEMYRTAEHAREAERAIDAGKQRIERVEVTAVLRDAVEAVTAEYPDARIRTDLPDEAVATAAPVVGFAFEELLTNAVKHNDSPIEVEVECDVRADAVTVRIADNGPGIPDSELETMVQDVETALLHSSGLGLWVVQWILDGSGGSVAFGGNERGGTTVSVRLPRDGERGPD